MALWLSLSSACGAAGLSCHSHKADIIWFCVLQTAKVLINFFPSNFCLFGLGFLSEILKVKLYLLASILT